MSNQSMSSIGAEFADQQTLWDSQHAMRGGQNGLEGDHLVDTPNDSALLLNDLLGTTSTIAELGVG